eukprot:Sdes_comp9539_c0_seq1m1016
MFFEKMDNLEGARPSRTYSRRMQKRGASQPSCGSPPHCFDIKTLPLLRSPIQGRRKLLTPQNAALPSVKESENHENHENHCMSSHNKGIVIGSRFREYSENAKCGTPARNPTRRVPLGTLKPNHNASKMDSAKTSNVRNQGNIHNANPETIPVYKTKEKIGLENGIVPDLKNSFKTQDE